MVSLLLAIIYLAFISLGLPDSLIGAGWPVMYPELGVPVSFAGILTALISCGTITSSLFSDRLTLRFGAGRVTAVSVLLTALALLGFSVSRSFWIMLLLCIPYGLGAGAVDAAINNYAALHYNSRQMSWLHCFWGVGASISPYIMSYALGTQLSWVGGYRAVGIIQLCISAILFLSLPLWKGRNANEVTETGEPVKPLGLVQAFKLPGAACVFIAFFCYCGIESTAGLWASSYLNLFRGIDEETAAGCASLYYLGITAGRFLTGFVADRFGDRIMIRMGLLVILLGCIATALPVNASILPMAGIIIMGLGSAPVYPAFIHATPGLFGPEKSQAIIGIQMACAYTGSLLMPPLFGLLGEHITMALYPFFIALFVIVAFLMQRIMYKKLGK